MKLSQSLGGLDVLTDLQLRSDSALAAENQLSFTHASLSGIDEGSERLTRGGRRCGRASTLFRILPGR